MARGIQGTGNNDYTKAMLGDDLDLINADNDEDITAGTLNEEGAVSRGSRKKTQTARVIEDDDVEEIESDETDENNEEFEEPVVKEGQQTRKEPVYKADQVQKIVQTRVGTLNKRIERLSPYKSAFDKLSEITGMNIDQLMGRLNSMSETEQATILGMTPEQVRAARAARTEISTERGKNQTLSRQLEETQLKVDKNIAADYDLYKEEIDDLIADNPKLTLKQAYTLAKGDNAITAVKRDTEQRVINQQVINRQKGIVKPTGGSQVTPGNRIDQATVNNAKRVGMDPVEYAQYGSIDNIDAYRALKARNKK